MEETSVIDCDPVQSNITTDLDICSSADDASQATSMAAESAESFEVPQTSGQGKQALIGSDSIKHGIIPR